MYARVSVFSLRGLSPRARGKPDQHFIGAGLVGSIPACAGEAGNPRVAKSGKEVYPRVRGGSEGSNRRFLMRRGLSPRARGKRTASAPAPDRRGSIPACAGEAERSFGARYGTRVYPRVRGGSVG